MTLTKAELVAKLIEETGLTSLLPNRKSISFFEDIKVALENSERLQLSGLGNFRCTRQEAKARSEPKVWRAIPHFRPSRGDLQTRIQA